MPATESLIQSRRDLPTFLMSNGRWYELRRGCLYDSETGERITSSDKTTAHLLQYGELSEGDRKHWEVFGEDICRSASDAYLAVRQSG